MGSAGMIGCRHRRAQRCGRVLISLGWLAVAACARTHMREDFATPLADGKVDDPTTDDGARDAGHTQPDDERPDVTVPTGPCPDDMCDAAERESGSCPIDCGISDTCAPNEDGERVCEPAYGEDCLTCPLDCGICLGCPDRLCDTEAGENWYNCPEDCVEPPASCPNGTCEPELGEDCRSCQEDCWRECPECGDDTCDPATENCRTCAQDCPPADDPELCPACPSGSCDAELGENCHNCPADCGAENCPWCGNANCEPPFEDQFNCPSDCAAADPLECSAVLECAMGCIDMSADPGDPEFLSASCIGVCVAGACAHVRSLIDAFFSCAIPAALTAYDLSSVMVTCHRQVEACMGVRCEPE